LAAIKINNNNVFYAFREEVFCGIKLETDDGVIVCAHKVALVSVSPYFHLRSPVLPKGIKMLYILEG